MKTIKMKNSDKNSCDEIPFDYVFNEADKNGMSNKNENEYCYQNIFDENEMRRKFHFHLIFLCLITQCNCEELSATECEIIF